MRGENKLKWTDQTLPGTGEDGRPAEGSALMTAASAQHCHLLHGNHLKRTNKQEMNTRVPSVPQKGKGRWPQATRWLNSIRYQAECEEGGGLADMETQAPPSQSVLSLQGTGVRDRCSSLGKATSANLHHSEGKAKLSPQGAQRTHTYAQQLSLIQTIANKNQ